jgi:glycosyltransferase EpsE
MKDQIKVSVIMGVYNCEKTISKSIDSILRQTFTDWELIICDDCSDDLSYEISLNYQSQYPEKIMVLRNDKNQKLSYTLNRCIEVSKGELIARMDADDISFDNRLSVQVSYLDSNKNVGWIGSSVEMMDDNGAWGVRHPILKPTKVEIFLNNQFIHPTIMFRKSVLNAVGGYTVSKATRRGQDYDLWCKLTSAGYIGENLSDVLLYYREDQDSFSKRKWKYRIDNVIVRKKWYKELKISCKYFWTIYRPLLVGIIPKKLMQKIHRNRYGYKGELNEKNKIKVRKN